MSNFQEDEIICRSKARSDELTARKHKLQAQLTACKNVIRGAGLLPQDKYRATVKAQTNYAQELAAVEKELSQLRTERREIALAQNQRRSLELPTLSSPVPSHIISELCELRQHYQEFSADITRISSMRQMASEFVLKLNGIIKRAINQ
jgi:hypothetical protein